MPTERRPEAYVATQPSRVFDPNFQIDHREGSVTRTLIPVIEHFKAIALGTCVATLVFALAVMLMRPKYEAKMTLAAVGSSKLMGLDGGLASSLLNAANGVGVQATPQLVVQLLGLQGVMYPVAMSPMTPGSAVRVIDRIADKSVGDIDPAKVTKIMQSIISADYDRQTGLITLSVTHRDSGLARTIAQRLVNQARDAFVHASRAQATELRLAQTQRVDSADRRLRAAEDKLLAFNRENRVVAQYSAAYLEAQRLDRDVTIARTVYNQAVVDRETAVAKELEESPAVVVVDPIPARVPLVPKRLGIKLLVCFVLSLTAFSLFFVLRESFQRLGQTDDPERERLMAALQRVPIAGLLVFNRDRS